MLRAEVFDRDTAKPFRISSRIAEAGTAASATAAIIGEGISYIYYFLHSDEPQEPQATSILAEDYPVLAELWDNEADAIYDNL